MKTLWVALVVVGLTACATTPQVDYATMDPAGVAAATTIKGSKFDAVTTIEGPAIETRTRLPSTPGQMVDYYENRWVFLRGVKAKSVPAVHTAYVEVHYEGKGWRFYHGANFIGGVPATFIPIERKVVDCHPALCTYSEAFTVLLREEDVRGKGDIEFALKTRTAGDDVVTFPRSYVDGYLAAVDR